MRIWLDSTDVHEVDTVVTEELAIFLIRVSVDAGLGSDWVLLEEGKVCSIFWMELYSIDLKVVEKTGCPVIIDEMYRPFLDPDPGPICLRHPKIVSVWGLNKVHGLPQVRFGWGCGSPQLADQARRIFDSTTLHTSCLTDQVARAAMDSLINLKV